MPVRAKDVVYIESDGETAVKVFANRYGFDPCEEKCACCGMAYIPYEDFLTLQEATADDRGCELIADENGVFLEEPIVRYDGSLAEYQTLDSYLGEPNVAVIYEQHICEADLEEFDMDWDDSEGDQNFYDLNEEWEE